MNNKGNKKRLESGMKNEDYTDCILKMLRTLNNKELKQIFEYSHMIYIKHTGD